MVVGVVVISQCVEVVVYNIVGGIDYYGIVSFFYCGVVIIYVYVQCGVGGIQLG